MGGGKEPRVGRTRAVRLAPTWRFPSTGGGEISGVNDAVLSHFSASLVSVVRETIQNSLDARLDVDLPVTVTFRVFSMPAESVPGKKDLQEVMQDAKVFPAGGANAEAVYDATLKVLANQNVRFLSITDSNTTGLRGGDDDHAGDWNRLTLQTGGSAKSAGSGGSFGVGKGAPFALSSLRTVFYSTRTADGVAFIGRARLSSFERQGEIYQASGFFGMNDLTTNRRTASVREMGKIPALFAPPEDQGTSIFIPMTWSRVSMSVKEPVQEVLANFWAAIARGRLEVHFEGEVSAEVSLTAETLPGVIKTYEDKKEPVMPYYQALQQEPLRRNLTVLGEVEVYVLVGEDMPKRVAWMRTPLMTIRKDAPGGMASYAGVFVCTSMRGNELLRAMEPPEHDRWVISRVPAGMKTKAQDAMKELRAVVMEAIVAAAGEDTSEIQDIPALEDLLSFEDDETFKKDQVGGSLESADESDVESGREKNASADDVLRQGTAQNGYTHAIPLKVGTQAASTGGFPKPPQVEVPTGETNKPGTPSSTIPASAKGPEAGVSGKLAFSEGLIWVERRSGVFVYIASLLGAPGARGSVKLKLTADTGNLVPRIESVADTDSGTVLVAVGDVIEGVTLDDTGRAKLLFTLSDPGRYALSIVRGV